MTTERQIRAAEVSCIDALKTLRSFDGLPNDSPEVTWARFQLIEAESVLRQLSHTYQLERGCKLKPLLRAA